MTTKNHHSQEENEVLKDQQAKASEQAEAQAQNAQHAEEGSEELTPEQKLEKELEEAKKTIEEQKDKYLRLSAEFDNYRKRTMKEKAELIKNGGEKLSVPFFRFSTTWNALCRTCRKPMT